MPICKKCGNEWSWWQTVKKSTFTGNGMVCPYCKEKQFLSASLGKRNIILVLIIIILYLVNVFLDLSLNMTIIIAVIMGLILIGINPFLIKLSNEKELPF